MKTEAGEVTLGFRRPVSTDTILHTTHRGTSKSAEALDTSTGMRVWCKGATWTVVELDGTTVLLRSANRFQRVHALYLVGAVRSLLSVRGLIGIGCSRRWSRGRGVPGARRCPS